MQNFFLYLLFCTFFICFASFAFAENVFVSDGNILLEVEESDFLMKEIVKPLLSEPREWVWKEKEDSFKEKEKLNILVRTNPEDRLLGEEGISIENQKNNQRFWFSCKNNNCVRDAMDAIRQLKKVYLFFYIEK